MVGVEGMLVMVIFNLEIYCIICLSGFKYVVQKLVFVVIVQGFKCIFVGDEIYEYDFMYYLVVLVDLLVVGKVMVISFDEFYLGLWLELDIQEIGELIGDENLLVLVNFGEVVVCGLYVNWLDVDLFDVVLCLLCLYEILCDVLIMVLMIWCEILYCLLMNGQGVLLCQIVLQDSQMNCVVKVICFIKEGFDQVLCIEDVVCDVYMSVFLLYYYFKLVMVMSLL